MASTKTNKIATTLTNFPNFRMINLLPEKNSKTSKQSVGEISPRIKTNTIQRFAAV